MRGRGTLEGEGGGGHPDPQLCPSPSPFPDLLPRPPRRPLPPLRATLLTLPPSQGYLLVLFAERVLAVFRVNSLLNLAEQVWYTRGCVHVWAWVQCEGVGRSAGKGGDARHAATFLPPSPPKHAAAGAGRRVCALLCAMVRRVGRAPLYPVCELCACRPLRSRFID